MIKNKNTKNIIIPQSSNITKPPKLGQPTSSKFIPPPKPIIPIPSQSVKSVKPVIPTKKPIVIKPSGNQRLDAKKESILGIIYKITDEYESTKSTISIEKIQKITDVSNMYNILLPNDILNILYENKKNVRAIIPYVEPRLIKFFDSKKLLPSKGDKLFDVRMMNLCVKVKKDKLVFEDQEVYRSKQFEDMSCLLVACKLYIWNTKINKCAIFNTMDDNDIKIRSSKELERLCNIANVPIKTIYPDSENGDSLYREKSDEELENEEKEDNEEKTDEEKTDEEKTDEEKTDEEKTDEEKNDEEKTDENPKEEFKQFNLTKKYANKHKLFILNIAVFLIILFIIYIKFK